MSKQVLKKDMVLISLTKNLFYFYNVEVLSIGYNEIQVIVGHGSLGNRGRENIKRFTDFKEAMKFAYDKIYEKKGEGYVSREKMEASIGALMRKERGRDQVARERTFKCDLCGKSIQEEVYKKIDDWARSKGGWDKNPQGIAYKKVLCIDCQIEHDIFKNKLHTSKKGTKVK